METLLKPSFCDAISENRNKSYGQYELRTQYGDRILTSLSLVLSSLGILTIGVLCFTPELKADKVIPEIPDDRIFTKVLTIYEKPKSDKPRSDVEKLPPPPPPRTENAVNATKNLPLAVAKEDDQKIDSSLVNNKKAVQEPIASTAKGLPSGMQEGDTNGQEGKDNGVAVKASGPGFTEGDPQITDFPDSDPEFSGNLESYLVKSTKYPVTAINEGIEGQVFVCFIIDESGKVTKPEVLKGIGYGCDEEAIRVITNLPNWKPGKVNGRPVKVRMRVPFKFRLK